MLSVFLYNPILLNFTKFEQGNFTKFEHPNFTPFEQGNFTKV